MFVREVGNHPLFPTIPGNCCAEVVLGKFDKIEPQGCSTIDVALLLLIHEFEVGRISQMVE